MHILGIRIPAHPMRDEALGPQKDVPQVQWNAILNGS